MTKLTAFKVLITRSTQNNKENGDRIYRTKIKSGVEKDEERVCLYIIKALVLNDIISGI